MSRKSDGSKLHPSCDQWDYLKVQYGSLSQRTAILMRKVPRIILRQLVCVLLMVWLLAISTTAYSATATVQLSELLQGFRTYQATFEQVTLDDRGTVTQRNRGRVMIQRPGKFRWETDTPTRRIIIVNGQRMWTYDVDLEQATRRQLNLKANANPAALLSGSMVDLTHQFNVSLLPGQAGRFLLTPQRECTENFKSVELRFKNHRLVGMKIVNNLAETSLFTFANIRLNTTLAAQLFLFKPPPGVDVVTQ